MSQLKLELREPGPDDYRRASQVEKPKDDLVGDVKTSELSEEEVVKLYKRAEDISEKVEDEKDFFQREKSLKPPRKGEIVKESFPPPIQLEKPEELLREEEEIRKELKVIRVMPEGNDMETVPQVVVTFNQPMVPITSVDDLKKYPVPVKMHPTVEGEWRWVGTKTVKWKPSHRLPKSTNFEVIVPQGVKSEMGCEFREDFTFSFSTIPVKMTKMTPSSDYYNQSVGPDSPILIEFNQKINQEDVLKMIRVNNTQDAKLIPMKLEEIQEFIDSGNLKKKLRSVYNAYESRIKIVIPEQYVCFRFDKTLPLSTSFGVTLRTGCPSKEGPRVTTNDETKIFKTYGPFIKDDHYPKKNIVPNQAWSITLSNNIELDDFDPTRDIGIDPAIPQVKIVPSGRTVTIHGQSKGNTNYTVTLKSSMKDIYGQPLRNETVTFSVGRARQNMYGFFNHRMVVHDMSMSKEPEFEVVSINLAKIRVVVRQVEPWEFHKSALGKDYHYFRREWGPGKEITTIDRRMNCGKVVYDEVITVGDKPDELVVTNIPLSPYLQHMDEKCGQLLVYVEPDEESWTKNEFRHAPRVLTWIQVTHLAVDCLLSLRDLYGFCSSLEDGRPVGEANFSLVHPLRKVGRAKKEYEDRTITKIGEDDGSVFMSGIGSSDLLIVEKGVDKAFTTDIVTYSNVNDRVLAYIINDRNLYKPKETVSIKGILRHMLHYRTGRTLEIPKISEDISVSQEIQWVCIDSRGAKIKEGKIKPNEYGTFFLEIELPDNINLGDGHVHFSYYQTSFQHTFKVQEFRTPEFKSSAKVEQKPYFADSVAIVDGKAEYFSGGGLSGCDVTWKVSQSSTVYYPPSFTFKGFSFDCSYTELQPKDENESNHAQSNLFRDPFGGFGFGGFGGGGGRLISPLSSEKEKKLEGQTDGSGEHKLCVEFRSNADVEIKKPTVVKCDLNVQDINRQIMSSSTSFTVHPCRYYVGIKKKKYFARKGEIFPMDLVVTDLNGTMIPNVDIEMKILNRFWERKGYRWSQKEVKVGEGRFRSKREPIPVDIKLEQGGNFFFVCSVVDPDGRFNFCSTSVWVAGGKEKGGGSRIQQEEAKLIGNKIKYEAEDEAKILVSSPFSPAEGMMVVICDGFVMQQRFHVHEDSTLLTVPIRREYAPGIQCEVFLVGKSLRIDEGSGRPNAAAPTRPAFARGGLYLDVSMSKETLEVKVEPDRKTMRPGEEGVVTIEVKSPEDEKFRAEGTLVSLIIVDEAVLSLTGYSLPHPISTFYPRHMTSCISKMFRSSVVMKDWSSIVCQSPPVKTNYLMDSGIGFGGFGGGGGGGMNGFFSFSSSSSSSSMAPPQPQGCFCAQCDENTINNNNNNNNNNTLDCLSPCSPHAETKTEEDSTPIEVRTDFRPLAVFITDSKTNSDGKVVIPFKLPDNLTSYRIWVLAHHENTTTSFGLGESSIQAQLPVAIRPSLPRFLNFGDLADFTVVVQNQTLETVHVKIAVRMSNLRLVDKKSGVMVSIPYAQRAELRFPVRTSQCGTGRFQVIGQVCGTNFTDAVEKSIPIFTPSTSEAFASYGEIDGDGVLIQSIKTPEDVYNQFGGLSITTSSTALQSLTDAFLYLYRYKFDCMEQISSRMLSINALQKFLYEFNVPKMPTKREIRKVMDHGFKKIKGSMRNDGAIGFWSLSSRVNIYLSIFVAHNLIRCKENGFDPEKVLIDRSKAFCQNIDAYINQYASWYGEFARASLRAFSLYVMTIYGLNGELSGHEMDRLSKRAEEMYREKKKYFTHEGKVWLMFCLFVCSREKANHPIVKEILQFIMRNVNETPETANFITSYQDDGKLVMLHSNRRTDGIILEMLCHVDPKNPLIPKLVKGLVAHKKKGRWNSTQENVYILMAMKKYFETFESLPPDFVAKVWLGDGYAGEVKFKGREVDYKSIEIPMNVLLPDSTEDDDIVMMKKKDLVVSKKGQGRLYYRLGMDYAPKSHDLKPVDYGFIVERSYEHVTEKDHVQKLENGVWKFKAGELIRVKLRLTNVSRRYHVALVDFIPAGCEVLNPELKGTEKVPQSAISGGANRLDQSPFVWSWWRSFYPWYEHVNVRDERVEAFSSYLYCGSHEYEYVMRATSLGEFVVPPSKAEEMYSPEIFGRSSSEKVLIVE